MFPFYVPTVALFAKYGRIYVIFVIWGCSQSRLFRSKFRGRAISSISRRLFMYMYVAWITRRQCLAISAWANTIDQFLQLPTYHGSSDIVLHIASPMKIKAVSTLLHHNYICAACQRNTSVGTWCIKVDIELIIVQYLSIAYCVDCSTFTLSYTFFTIISIHGICRTLFKYV